MRWNGLRAAESPDENTGAFVRLTYGGSKDPVYFVASRINGYSVCCGLRGCGALIEDTLLGQHEAELHESTNTHTSEKGTTLD